MGILLHESSHLKILFPFHSSKMLSLENTLPFHSTDVEKLPAGLRPELMPRHVGVIMDGSGRWAKQRGLSPLSGYQAGELAFRQLVEHSSEWGIKVLSVFCFSQDNWKRPKVEIDFLMNLFEAVIKRDMDYYLSKGIKISVIGDLARLPQSLEERFTNVVEMTKNNSGLQLIFAVSYNGQHDIVEACKTIAHKVKDGLIRPEDINEIAIERELETSCTEFPSPDLLIRTSGELRISNFMLWQLAYTELFFAPALWPDFGEAEFVEALRSFQQRQRRFGKRDS